jgi:hypothetical protein
MERRGGRPGRVLALLLLLCATPAAWADLGVQVTDPDPARNPVTASFRVAGPLDGADLSTLGEGVPATLTLIIDLWREKSGWWDALVVSQTRIFTFRRDLLQDEFVIRNPDGSETRVADRDSLAAYLENPHEVVLGEAARFPEGQEFYLSVKAVVRPLSVEEIERLDAWLSGDVTEGRGGGLLGFPRALVGLVVDLSGLGDRSAVGRSGLFSPNP